MPRITVNCATCGIGFEVKASHVERRKTCSKKCFGEYIAQKFKGEGGPGWKGGLVAEPCVICGKTTERRRDHAYKYRATCSQECKAKLMGAVNSGINNANYKGLRDVQCSNCGTALKRYPCHADTQEYFFCNAQCQGDWREKTGAASGENNGRWRGGWQDYYGPDWEAQRRAARQRDKHACQRCGRKHKKDERQFDVHHIVAFREFGYIPGENEKHKQANDLANLVTLCNFCHQQIEHGHSSFQLSFL